MKSGPKLEDGVLEVKQKIVMLDELSEQRLRALGAGNLSRGARKAARVAYEAYQHQQEPEPATTGETT